MRNLIACILTIAILAFAPRASAQPDNAAGLRIPLTVSVPDNVSRDISWPLTTGVPFPKGMLKDVSKLALVNDAGEPVPCQIKQVAHWREDKSVRWAWVDFVAQGGRSYFVVEGSAQAPATPLVVETADNSIIVTAGPARYTFTQGKGNFTNLALDINADGRFDPQESIAQDAGDAFYIVDSQGRRSTLKADRITVEMQGTQRSVVRVEGLYTTEADERVAAATVYYHFFAGLPRVKISHKLIVTEDTNKLWFRDIGMKLPVALTGEKHATFNHNHAFAGDFTRIALPANQSLSMLQQSFPHFGKDASVFTIAPHTAPDSEAGAPLVQGKAAGDWADISNSSAGIAAQLPALAEQFPKSIIASDASLTIKLWAGEAGKELDFRTEKVIPEYFGSDWIPDGHPWYQLVTQGRSSARTHDIWLYPHAGQLDQNIANTFGATRNEIYATVDPQWMSDTRVMGHWLPRDLSGEFAKAERVVEDYYRRHVTLTKQVFPTNGYLAYGIYPYVAQPWEQKNGRWYPTLHRLSRQLEYNLKRVAWVLWARSGEREYRDYARRYTRFLGDMTYSNWDSNLKPKGWIIQGDFNSAMFYGAFPADVVAADEKPGMTSEISVIGYGTSEDTINFAWDYLIAGDYHSRDIALAYREAVFKEIGSDYDKALSIVPVHVMLRPFTSTYEIDQSEKVYEFQHALLERIAGKGDLALSETVPSNHLKDGELYAAFYYNWLTTGDPLAKEIFLKYARNYYRTDRLGFMHRGSALAAAFAVAFEEERDPAYISILRQFISETASRPTLHEQGINPDEVDARFPRSWGAGHAITDVVPHGIGVTRAIQALHDHPQPTPSVPLAVKMNPTARTYLLFEKVETGPQVFDLYINNFDRPDAQVKPQVLDAAGKPVAINILAAEVHKVGKPRGDANWQHEFNAFYNTFGSHMFYKVQIDAPPGVYHVPVPDAASFSILYSDIHKWVQVAPEGLSIKRAHKYYFEVDGSTPEVTFFTYRPVRVFDPAGNETPLESLSQGRYRFKTGSKAGAWYFVAGADSMLYGETSADGFVKFESMPMVVAMDEATRLFDVDASKYPAANEPASLATAGEEATFVEGKFGKAAYLPNNRYIELPIPAEKSPRGSGTLEFWYRPMSSSSDLYYIDQVHGRLDQQFAAIGPMLLQHRAMADNSGRTGRYHAAMLETLITKTKGAEVYPVSLHLHAGRWHHIALTWHFDGKDSDVNVFINGRKMVYATYRGGVNRTVSPDDLAPATAFLRVGNTNPYGKVAPKGGIVDDVRVSTSVRYTDEFTPPAAPFANDADTFALMPLDGSYSATVAGNAATGEVKSGSKLQP